MAQVMSFGTMGTMGAAGTMHTLRTAQTRDHRSADASDTAGALRGVAVLAASAVMTIGLCWMALGAVMDNAATSHRSSGTQVVAGNFVPLGMAASSQGYVAPSGTAR